jgi:hypothetical protein
MMDDGYKLFEVENSMPNKNSTELSSPHEVPRQRMRIVF